MQRHLTNKAIKAILAIERMYPNCDLQVAIENKYITIHWIYPTPYMVTTQQGRKIDNKLIQVKEILKDRFIETYWGGDRQFVYASF
jgi:hypothetical protein